MIHLFHKWGKWSLAEAKYDSFIFGEYSALVQVRTCAVCGKVETRRP